MGKSDSPSQKSPIGHKRKIGFVCSGGATKAGAFHLGVALALQEQGFRFYGGLSSDATALSNPGGQAIHRTPGPMEISTYVGSSAGSIIATYLAAGYSLDNIFNSFLGRKAAQPLDPRDATPKLLASLTYQKMFRLRTALAKEQLGKLSHYRKMLNGVLSGDWESLLQLRWLKATGIFSTLGIEQYLREEVLLSNRFQDYAPELFIVATQLNHSRKVVFGKYSYEPPPHDLTCQYDNDAGISDACAASTALPPVYTPHAIKNHEGHSMYYIDGEIRDTLSTHVAVDAGADLVIASYTHQPYHFQKEIGSLTDYGIPAILIQSIYLLIEQKINNHIHAKDVQRDAILAVSQYCKESGLDDKHRKRICELMENKLAHRMDVDTIYIHPDPKDSQMFFGEHFSLSPKKMTDIVRSGFKAAIDVLRRYDFADRTNDPAIGMTSSGRRERKDRTNRV